VGRLRAVLLNEYTRLLLQDAGVPGNMSSVSNLLFHAVHSDFSDQWPFGPVTRPPPRETPPESDHAAAVSAGNHGSSCPAVVYIVRGCYSWALGCEVFFCIYICCFITVTWLLILRIDITFLTHALELKIGNISIIELPLQKFWRFFSACMSLILQPLKLL